MIFNVPITLNRVTFNQYAEPEVSKSYSVKCAITDFTKRPVKRSSGKSETIVMTIMLPHKNIEPYKSIVTTTQSQTFVYNGVELQVGKINPIPGFSGGFKYYEVVLKEIVSDDDGN